MVSLRLTTAGPETYPPLFGASFASVMSARLKDADAFYASITPKRVGEDEARVMRQALAGMLWSKQYYLFDADRWLREHDVDPLNTHGRRVRNTEWFHMMNDDVISMPDRVGVPLVRGLGPRLSHHCPGPRGHRLREAPARADAPVELPAPERADARPTSGTSAT